MSSGEELSGDARGLFATTHLRDSIDRTLAAHRGNDPDLTSPEHRDANLRPRLQDDTFGGNLWMKYMRNGDHRYMAGMYFRTLNQDAPSMMPAGFSSLGFAYLFTLFGVFVGSTAFGVARFAADRINHEAGTSKPNWRRYANLAMNEMGVVGPHLASKMALTVFALSMFNMQVKKLQVEKPKWWHPFDMRQAALNPFLVYGVPVFAAGYFHLRRFRPHVKVALAIAALAGSVHIGYRASSWKDFFGVFLQNDKTLKREPWKRYDHKGHTVDPGYQVVAVNEDGTLDPENKNGNLKEYPHPFPYTPENMDVVAELGALRPRYIPCNNDWTLNVRDEGDAMSTWIAGVEKDQNHLHNGMFGVKHLVFHGFVPPEQAAAWKEDPEMRKYPFYTFRRPTGEAGKQYAQEREEKANRVKRLQKYRTFAHSLHQEAPRLPAATTSRSDIAPASLTPAQSLLLLDSWRYRLRRDDEDPSQLTEERRAVYNTRLLQEARSRMHGKPLMPMSYFRFLSNLRDARDKVEPSS